MDRRDVLAGLAMLGIALIGGNGDAMEQIGAIGVLFVAGFGPIVRDADASRKLYREALGISFKEETGGYLHTGDLKGTKEFALWPLSQAARSCFGNDSWPSSVPIPQAWLEFDVEDVEKATAQLESRGYRMLIRNKKEPWGQTVSRFISPEGMLVGITFTPSLRQAKQ
jgi:catechol 2,3-dioxygenase-like lactoylglutathione lyase family enzyme